MPKLIDCITPIWGATESGIPELIATGTLLDLGRAKLLVTAAHVLDWNLTTTLYFNAGKQLEVLGGASFRTALPESECRKDDRIDIGCIRLSDAIADKLRQSFYFLPIALVNANDRIQPQRHYMFTGFPVTTSKVKVGEKMTKSQRWTFTSVTLSPKEYQKMNLSPETHIAIEFNKKRVKDESKRMLTAPDPNGVSGGAVWSVERHPLKPNVGVDLRLVGIGIEHRHEHKALVATRIGFALEGIRNYWPDLESVATCDWNTRITVDWKNAV
jgi:hypothetical protein